jgi:hypothetical protein
MDIIDNQMRRSVKNIREKENKQTGERKMKAREEDVGWRLIFDER